MSIDERWFLQLQTLSQTIGETYELLEPSPDNITDARRAFEAANFSTNINLYPDRVDIEKLTQARAQLAQLRASIVANEPHEIVRTAYLASIDMYDTNAHMLTAAAQRDMHTFARCNTALYSQPDKMIFKATCAWIRHEAELSHHTKNSQLQQLAEKILSLIPKSDVNYSLLVPDEAVFNRVRNLHKQHGGYYDTLFGVGGLPTSNTITEKEGNAICLQVLKNIGSEYTLAPSDNNLWAIMPSRKQVVYPRGYRLSRNEFIGIVCHEIGSHILESVNGASSQLKLLSAGLAGFEKGNEGRAFLREQIVYSHERTFLKQFAWEYIVLLHLAVSLAAGGNGAPYAFAKLYETLFTLYYFWGECRKPNAHNNEAFARQEAWYLTVRVLKGTPGDGSAAYLKDMVYLEGNVKCWQLAVRDPAIILFGDSGKFDCTNPQHSAIVSEVMAH